MDRPTTPFSLTVSGYDVQLVTYFTKGEDDAINRYGLEGAEVVVEPDPVTGQDQFRYRNMPVDRYRREVAKLLELGVVSASKDGTSVEVGAQFVESLPTKDVDLLTERLI